MAPSELAAAESEALVAASSPAIPPTAWTRANSICRAIPGWVPGTSVLLICDAVRCVSCTMLSISDCETCSDPGYESAGSPSPAGTLVDETVAVPANYNDKSTLTAKIEDGKVNVKDFDLQSGAKR